MAGTQADIPVALTGCDGDPFFAGAFAMNRDDLRFLAIALGIVALFGGVGLYFSGSIADALSRHAMQRWALETLTGLPSIANAEA